MAFERLLTRLFAVERPPWLLKGGYALEMRLQNTARATKDIDLTIPDALALGTELAVETVSERLLDLLREALEQDQAADRFRIPGRRAYAGPSDGTPWWVPATRSSACSQAARSRASTSTWVWATRSHNPLI